MFGLSVDQAKSTFFDRKPVVDAVDRATRQVLSRFGAFVRTRARSSIRKRKAVSAPGDPPSSHEGTLRRLIFFAYDAARKGVVIGPTQSRPGSEVPRLLEYGGEAVGGRDRRRRLLRYRARPFMSVAFQQELPGLPAMWRGAVRG
jgi:hypothetical protein